MANGVQEAVRKLSNEQFYKQTAIIQPFYNGKEDSTWYFYYENKVLKAIENYNRGKKNGHNYYYSKTSELAQETVFNQNLPDSLYYKDFKIIYSYFEST